MTVEFPPMDELLRLQIQQQPDDYSCGPTCLQAVYRYFGLEKDLQELISEVAYLREGGTLAVQLGCHALRSGFSATIYTYNLQVFDPTWFGLDSDEFRLKLQAQTEAKENAKLEFTDEALHEIACIAQKKNTGARGLRSVIEQAMFDIMYELAEQEAGKKYVLTPEVIRGTEQLLPTDDSAAA